MNMLIAIEGLDGSGKSTVAAQLAAKINATHVFLPGATKVGKAIRGILFGTQVNTRMMERDTASALFLADFIEAQAKIIWPSLRRGHVVCDRWGWISDLAYGGSGLYGAYAKSEIAIPDHVYVLTANPDTLCERISRREKPEQQNKAWSGRERMLQIQQKYEEIMPTLPYPYTIIDTSGTQSHEVVEQIIKAQFPAHVREEFGVTE